MKAEPGPTNVMPMLPPEVASGMAIVLGSLTAPTTRRGGAGRVAVVTVGDGSPALRRGTRAVGGGTAAAHFDMSRWNPAESSIRTSERLGDSLSWL